MKKLKLFEEFKLGVAYTPEEEGSVSKIDVNGFEVIFIDYSTSSPIVGDYKIIYTVEILGKLGTLTISGLCFSNFDVAKEHIKRITAGNKEQGPLPKYTKFVIRGLKLDEGSSAVSSSGQSSGVMDLVKDFPPFLERNLEPIVKSYSKILKSNTLREDKLTTSLKEMIRICKTGDMNRINVFHSNFVKMIRPLYSENNKKAWDLSQDGRKWKSVIDQFETAVGLREISGGPVIKY